MAHGGIKADAADAAVGAALKAHGPAVGVDDGKPLHRKVLRIGKQHAHVAPVAPGRFVGIQGIRAVGVAVHIPKAQLFGAAALLGHPGGVHQILRQMGAGAGQALAAVTGGAGVIRTLQAAQALAPDMHIFNGLGVLDAQAAIGGAEKIIPAAVGQLDAAITQDHRGVGGNLDGPVQQPPGALRLDSAAPGRDDHRAATAQRCKGIVQNLAVRQPGKGIYIDHNASPSIFFVIIPSGHRRCQPKRDAECPVVVKQ